MASPTATLPQTILVTGATGFVGQALCAHLTARGHSVITAGRDPNSDRPLGDLSQADQHAAMINPALFEGIDQVVHLAAIAHRSGVSDDAYKAVNQHAPIALAKAAMTAGCQRFIFLSTAKILGDTGRTLTDDNPANPPDAYAHAKRQAELGLAEIAANAPMDVISLRPPLIHGPNAQANMARLVTLIQQGGVYSLPVPLGSTRNQRSLISRDNLAAAIACVIEASIAKSGEYLIAEQPAVSTGHIIRDLAQGMGRKAPLFAFPPALLRGLLTLMGKGSVADRLLGDFSLDDSRFRATFGWQTDQDTHQSLIATGQAIGENDR